ncbi:hypothetical protein CU098_012434 [Rhizopus stolonifer]|uniref:Uncharacterized protein n=1 Tax=Rhizopus stolonifer TaxID=4846 RepID=A0A367KU66_RHIST|nr:hypothetical protein CU098_012434 [Rhizopus stolonifer]
MYKLTLHKTRLAALNARPSTRYFSTQKEPKTGPSKTFIASLLLAAGGFAYYQRQKEESNAKETNRKIAELGQRVIQNGQVKGDLKDAQYHLKESARSTGDATQDAYSKLKQEGREAADQMKSHAHDAASKAQDKYEDAKDSLKDNKDSLKAEKNPMVKEKVSPIKTKSHPEEILESEAEHRVKDTSGLVGKDTDKVKPVWDDKGAKERSANSPKVVVDHDHSKGGFLGGIFGSSDSDKHDNNVVHNERMPSVPVTQRTVYDPAPTVHGNPMAYEKRHKDPTKPAWEVDLERHAHDNVRDTSGLVGKDTDKVRAVWEEKAVRDDGRHAQPKEHSESFWSNLIGKTNDTASDISREATHEKDKLKHQYEQDKEKVGSMWQDVKDKASMKAKDVEHEAHRIKGDADNTIQEKTSQLQSGWNKVKNEAQSVVSGAQETASDVSGRLKAETDKASANAQYEKERLKRGAVDSFQEGKDRLGSGLNELQREASSGAEKLKAQTEETAKSWYQSGTEHVKSGISTVKDVADQELQWAEQKAQEAKKEVSQLLSPRKPENTGLSGHVKRGERYAEVEEGVLRPTRPNTDLKPAEVVVENASGKEM